MRRGFGPSHLSVSAVPRSFCVDSAIRAQASMTQFFTLTKMRRRRLVDPGVAKQLRRKPSESQKQ